MIDTRDLMTASDLIAYGLANRDVERLCPGAIERTGLDGLPCWDADDLVPLVSESEGRTW